MNLTFKYVDPDCVDINDVNFINIVRNRYAKKYLHDSREFTIKQSMNWFKTEYLNNTDGVGGYHIIYNNDARIGYFRISNYDSINKKIMIGADIHPDHTGNGYAKIAYKLMMDHLFTKYDLNKISLEVLATNDRAYNLYKKLGFVEEGRKRQDSLKGETFVDSIMMSILRSEYKQ